MPASITRQPRLVTKPTMTAEDALAFDQLEVQGGFGGKADKMDISADVRILVSDADPFIEG